MICGLWAALLRSRIRQLRVVLGFRHVRFVGELASEKRGLTWNFSENHLKNYHGFDWGPCEGGNADISTAYLARWSGPALEADDPYRDYDDRPSPGGPTQKYLNSALWFFTEADIKNAVMNYGGFM
jgi:C1A family cysteine protease